MLSNETLQRLFILQNMPPTGRLAVENIRQQEPSRRVGGGTHNVACRFASRKMGRVIQAESHKCELPAIYLWEFDPATHEFYDQVPPIKLSYLNGAGKRVTHPSTPDFFLIQEGWMGWVECKPEETLQELHAGGSGRFVPDDHGGWRCPPGEEFAAQYGLGFRVCSSKDFNWMLVRNLEFLSDYLGVDCPEPSKDERQALEKAFALDRWLLLSDLLAMEGVTADAVYALIAQEALYADLEGELLAEPIFTHVCRDALSFRVYREQKRGSQASKPQSVVPLKSVSLQAGTRILWDGVPWRILNVGQDDICVEDEAHVFSTLRHDTFRELVTQGAITGLPEESDDCRRAADEILRRASGADLDVATRRQAAIEAMQRGEVLSGIPARTLRYWAKLARDGEIAYGNLYVGLVAHTGARGNRQRKVDPAVIELMNQVIDEEVLSSHQPLITVAYGALINRCDERGLLRPSEKTFRAEIKRRREEEIILAREGRRASYSVTEFIWIIDQSTPRHGERPFEIGHIDHTQVDCELVDSRTGANLGRPWLTILMDAFTRMILAFFLTFDPPSYRSCMAVIRAAIQRHNRIPKTIVVDKGSDFEGAYFERLLARLGCHKKSRPAAKARFGSVIERLFGVANQSFFHNLRGNTQASKEPRRMSPSHNPKHLAVWTLPALTAEFEAYAFETYANLPHAALGVSPRMAMEHGLANSGRRAHTLIPDTETFRLMCLPTTPLGKAKVRVGKGIKIRGIFYWHAAFRDPRTVGTTVDIRYDPFDISRAYAYVDGGWQLCRSEYQALFERRTEREIATLSQEIIGMMLLAGTRRQIRAAELAHHLAGIRQTEAVLLQQRRDAELLGTSPSLPPKPNASAPIPDAPAQDLWADHTDTTIFEELK